MKENKKTNYLKRASILNTFLIGVFLVWFIYSLVEMIKIVKDALDGVLEYFYKLPSLFGLNKAELTRDLSIFFVVLSFAIVIALLYKGLNADKGIKFGSGLYYLIIFIGILSLGYFVSNAFITSTAFDLRAILFIVFSLLAVIISILIISNLSKVGYKNLMEDDYSDYEEIIDDRSDRYNQDVEQFNAIVNDHEGLSEHATKSLIKEDLMNTKSFDNSLEKSDTITIDLESLKKEMEEANFSSDQIKDSEFVQIDNSMKNIENKNTKAYSAIEEVDFTVNPSKNDGVLQAKSNFAEVFMNKDLDKFNSEHKKNENLTLFNDLKTKETAKSDDSFELTDEFKEFSSRIETKVIAMPGDDSKVIVVKKTYQGDNLVSETSEIKNKSDFKNN